VVRLTGGVARRARQRRFTGVEDSDCEFACKTADRDEGLVLALRAGGTEETIARDLNESFLLFFYRSYLYDAWQL
jgi:hypothetical protein